MFSCPPSHVEEKYTTYSTYTQSKVRASSSPQADQYRSMRLLARLLLLLAAAATIPTPSDAAGKVLFFMPLVSPSMKICFMPIAQELARRGHQVTVLMPFKQEEQMPGVEVITIESRVAELRANMSRMKLEEGADTRLPFAKFVELAMDSNEKALTHPSIAKLTANPETKFDVVMVSAFFASEVGYYLAHRFDAELALFSTFQASIPFIDTSLGQPHNPVLTPLVFLESYSHPMSFLQRVMNSLVTFLYSEVARNWYVMGRLEDLVDKHFPEAKGKRPTLLEMEKQAAVGLHFGHPLILDGLKPVAPNFQYLGMMNCRQTKALPQDLEKFMASAQHGVVYVSFGTVLTASEMSDEKLSILLKVFGSLKQKVLWKWEKEAMPDKPANVKLSKWLPQQDVLGHPKTVAFLMHGGQSSFQECLCHQKPTVTLPVMFDQPANGNEVERMGFGITIPFCEITVESLTKSLNAVISDPGYTDRARKWGSLLVDQQTRPLDRAIWWLEFAMRHPGVGKHHFKSPAHDLRWYEVAMLDVFAFLVAATAAALMLVAICCRCLCSKLGPAKYKQE